MADARVVDQNVRLEFLDRLAEGFQVADIGGEQCRACFLGKRLQSVFAARNRQHLPAAASVRTVAVPIPLVAPVTMALLWIGNPLLPMVYQDQFYTIAQFKIFYAGWAKEARIAETVGKIPLLPSRDIYGSGWAGHKKNKSFLHEHFQ